MSTFRAAAAVLVLACALPCAAIVIDSGAVSSLNVTHGTPVRGVNLSGVVQVLSANGSCTGSLLSDGFSILTAGHCVANSYSAQLFGGFSINFMSPNGFVSASVDSVSVNPGWSGDLSQGDDLAVLRLSQQAPGTAARYSLFTGTPALNTVNVIAGYGYGGTGTTGYDSSLYPYGILRAGSNEYLRTGAYVGDDISLLVSELYDPNSPNTNVLHAPIPYPSNSSPAADAAGIAPGDSGGPTFQNGLLVGVHHTIGCFAQFIDSDVCSSPHPLIDASYGQFFEDTNVSTHINWIVAQEVTSVPEPATWTISVVGVALLGSRRLRHARAFRQTDEAVGGKVLPEFYRA